MTYMYKYIPDLYLVFHNPGCRQLLFHLYRPWALDHLEVHLNLLGPKSDMQNLFYISTIFIGMCSDFSKKVNIFPNG